VTSSVLELSAAKVRTLEERLGASACARRLALENRPQRLGKGRKHLPLQALEPAMTAARRLLEKVGLYRPLVRRALRQRLIENTVYVRGLPDDLAGVRILHLSDLHIDSSEGFGARLAEVCESLAFDAACITGDLRLDTCGPIDAVIREMTPLMRALTAGGRPVYAVLGNHDVLDLVAPLEALGASYLLNESVVMRRGAAELHWAGVDDAHYFGTDDLGRALGSIPTDAACLFLCHSPDLVREAAESFADLYLCGHTHGGQLCLPGGRPLVSNANCERRFVAGAWRYGSMQGYTSRGVGFSGVPLRAFCEAELVVHTLRRERRNRCRVEAEATLRRA
jgi:uncharacterized protein